MKAVNAEYMEAEMKIEHIALYVNDLEIAFSVGSKAAVDALTERLKNDGFKVVSGPRTTGDGYYESCIVAIEDNQIEITV